MLHIHNHQPLSIAARDDALRAPMETRETCDIDSWDTSQHCRPPTKLLCWHFCPHCWLDDYDRTSMAELCWWSASTACFFPKIQPHTNYSYWMCDI